jgi:hypothetical protein
MKQPSASPRRILKSITALALLGVLGVGTVLGSLWLESIDAELSEHAERPRTRNSVFAVPGDPGAAVKLAAGKTMLVEKSARSMLDKRA